MKSVKLAVLMSLLFVLMVASTGVSAAGFARRSCVVASSNIAGRGVLSVNVGVSMDTNGSVITRAYNTSTTMTGVPLLIQMSDTGSSAVIRSDRKSVTVYGWGRVWVGIKTPWFDITLLSRSYNGSCIARI